MDRRLRGFFQRLTRSAAASLGFVAPLCLTGARPRFPSGLPASDLSNMTGGGMKDFVAYLYAKRIFHNMLIGSELLRKLGPGFFEGTNTG